MPAAGGIKKSELYLDTPVKRPPVVEGNPLEPYIRPISPVIKVGSYVALWRNPRLSAYTFIWLNACILLYITFSIATPLTTTLILMLLTTNILMIEYSFTNTSVATLLLYSTVGVAEEELTLLPGASEVSQVLVNGLNGVCNVFLNIRETSEQGHAQFYFALCTTVAMVTIVLTYLATSTTFLILFWFFFCFPAIKHNQLHKRLTQEQIVSVFNMSMYMIYNMYKAVVNAFTVPPESQEEVVAQEKFGDTLHSEYEREMSDPATSLRSTTMSYIRGLPSAMTLNWGDGLKSWIRRRRGGDRAQPGLEMTPKFATTTESDSDFGIDDIDEDGGLPSLIKARAATTDTLSSNPDMDFPSIERRDTWDSEGTLAEGLDPALLFDEEDRTFTLDSESDFILGGTQRLHLLDAVTESGEESEATETSLTPETSPTSETSPTPEYQSIRSQQSPGSVDPLDGINYMIQSTPPAEPKSSPISFPHMIQPTPPAEPKSSPISSPHRRIKQSSEQSGKSDLSGKSDQSDRSSCAVTTDSEFYVISDEDIREAEDEMEDLEVSYTATTSSISQRITGSIRDLSGSNNPAV